MAVDHKGSAIQLPLVTEQFMPMPHGPRQYLIAVQNRKGERDALAHVEPRTWELTTPLVQFVGPKRGTERVTAKTVGGWARNVAGVVGSRPCYVDILRLQPTARVATGATTEAVLRVVFAACRKRGMRFVPVLKMGQGSGTEAIVRDAAAEDGRGVCLRYDIMNSVAGPSMTAAKLIEETLRAMEADLASADLILDLGWLDPDQALSADPIVNLLNEVSRMGDWRSVVMLGTSIPSTMSVVEEDSIGRIRRVEWDLWRSLMNGSVDRLPSFGDYGVQNPQPPFDPGGPGMRANVRYTIDKETVVARGRSVVQEGNEQYRELCQRPMALPEFCGEGYSWGDEIICGCAGNIIVPGGQDMWRGAGCSHHIQFTVDQLLTAQGSAN